MNKNEKKLYARKKGLLTLNIISEHFHFYLGSSTDLWHRYLPNPSGRMWHKIKAGVNPEFSFSKTGYLSKVKNAVCPTIYQEKKEKKTDLCLSKKH